MLTSKSAMWVCPHCRSTYEEGRFCPSDGAALRGSSEVQVPGLVLDRELGRGLTGTVWRARDEAGRIVAVKVLHREWADHPEMRERFLREARAAGTVHHPSVVAPILCGELDDGRPYISMELVDGPSLDDVLALGPLPEERAVAIAADLAGALAAVHRAGVVHRDVKPGNVRIDRDGRARLFDFGVARRLDGDEPRLTQGGLTVGTPHYMAPEQCSGEAVTGRTDVYALGVVLYRMLSATVPFDGAAVAVMLAHTARDPVPLRDRAPGVSLVVADLVGRCLAKRPADRPDAEELAERLEALRDGAAPSQLRLGRAETVPVELRAPARSPSEASSASLDDVAAVAGEAAPPPLAADPDDDPTNLLPPVRRRGPARRIAAFAFALAALATVAGTTHYDEQVGVDFDLARDLGIGNASIARGATPRPPLPAGESIARSYLVATDHGVALRLGAPARLVRNAEHHLTIEAWDDEGEPIDTTDLVVTFEGPSGAVVGLAAEPTRERGAYRVRTRFDRAGAWVVRVFPPLADTVVTFHLDVAEPIPNS